MKQSSTTRRLVLSIACNIQVEINVTTADFRCVECIYSVDTLDQKLDARVFLGYEKAEGIKLCLPEMHKNLSLLYKTFSTVSWRDSEGRTLNTTMKHPACRCTHMQGM